ncbi:hypothetical protein ABZ153_31545 [Streptomyces sp. NPDC006290]|uniref:hypothetical protein n=1 Tax=Streptomyces sp. NPDC006290 TaxID=3156745 RepID=UPI0033B0F962
MPAFRAKGQLAAHLVVRARAARFAFRAPIAIRAYNPSGSPHFIAEVDRAATPYSVVVKPDTPLMTKKGKCAHAFADHPADAMHLPSCRGGRHVNRRRLDAAPQRTARCRPPTWPGSSDVRAAHCWTEQDRKHVKRELSWAEFQARSGQRSNATDAGRRGLRLLPASTLHQRIPIVSDLARSGLGSLCNPELASLSITLAKGIGITLHRSP